MDMSPFANQQQQSSSLGTPQMPTVANPTQGVSNMINALMQGHNKANAGFGQMPTAGGPPQPGQQPFTGQAPPYQGSQSLWGAGPTPADASMFAMMSPPPGGNGNTAPGSMPSPNPGLPGAGSMGQPGAGNMSGGGAAPYSGMTQNMWGT